MDKNSMHADRQFLILYYRRRFMKETSRPLVLSLFNPRVPIPKDIGLGIPCLWLCDSTSGGHYYV